VSDDEDDEEPTGETEDGKAAIENEIFGEGADEDEEDEVSLKPSRRSGVSGSVDPSQEIDDMEGSEESGK
jgi:hypothetical protein